MYNLTALTLKLDDFLIVFWSSNCLFSYKYLCMELEHLPSLKIRKSNIYAAPDIFFP